MRGASAIDKPLRAGGLCAGAAVCCLLVAGCARSPAGAEPGASRADVPVVADVAAPAVASAAAPVAAAGLGPQDEIDATYPDDITPPPGTQYPCALTALPQDLPGVPSRDRRYLNRTYARILRATQAKLLVLRSLAVEPHSETEQAAALAQYLETTDRLRRALAAEPAPNGLEPFRLDVLVAVELQQSFFRRAVAVRRGGGDMRQVYAVPEGRQASRRLFSAWDRMRARYPDWSSDTRDSIYHHLCALDLF